MPPRHFDSSSVIVISERPGERDELVEWEANAAWFASKEDELRDKYPGRYIIVREQSVWKTGEDQANLLNLFWIEFGYSHVFCAKADDDAWWV